MKNGVCFDGLQIELDGICGWKQLYKLDECLPCNKGFRWIKLSIAPKRIRDFKTNKGLHYVRKNILG